MKMIIHARSPEAVIRARGDAAELQRENPEDMVRIVVDADGVAAVLEHLDPGTDHWVILCSSTMAERGLQAPAHLVHRFVSSVTYSRFTLPGEVPPVDHRSSCVAVSPDRDG